MTLYCPECWAKARCIESRCDPLTNSVIRRHQCGDHDCGHRFTSIEVIPGHIDMARMTRFTMVRAAMEMYDALEYELDKRAKIENARKAKKRFAEPNNRVERNQDRPAKDHQWRK